MKPAPLAWVAATALLCGALALLLAGRALDEPGLYYDEVIQAGPALEFLKPDGEPPRIPGARATRVFGRWLPWMTQPYMGALKSQLLIPVLSVGEPSAAGLRGTTLLWALLGLPLVMVFANRALGFGVAVIAGLLLAVDPSLLFLGRHDWGSFALAFLLRCASLPLLWSGWQSGSTGRLAAGGACLGLGVYNKIDFGVYVAAAALALLLTAPEVVRQALGEKRERLLAFAAGFTAGATPLLLALPGALSVAGDATQGGLGGAFPEKWVVLRSVLDGSYFQRLMEVGGRFDALAQAVPTPTLGFELFVAGVLGILAIQANRDLRGEGDRMHRFLVATCLLTLAGILLTPRALRAHHFLNAFPFPQLVLATAVVLVWTRASRLAAVPSRGMAVLMLGAALVSAVRMDLHTLELLRETGGRGRWSHAATELARSLPDDTTVVSLGWGFDGPLRFAAPGLRSEEPIWRLRAGARRGVELTGTAKHVYLVNEEPYAVFPFSRALLDGIGRLPPEAVRVETHADREGAPVFRSVHFASPHVLVYRGGRFEVRLQ